MIKEYYYSDDEDFSFNKFLQNYELQDFYKNLSDEDVCLVRMILEETTVRDMCKVLDINFKTYYNRLEDIKNKLIKYDYINNSKSKKKQND